MAISIRGSNARNGFGIRNIVILEDGFPVTQPGGLSRSDLFDPHAYSGIDVWRGPPSAPFGNYATGGALNFRTRPGGESNGIETASMSAASTI
jgi:iron complex outermembrane recepter protein